eukprot:CAMPEP_0169106144 /NCGR_PEP_ID=MMETSP1015-20121227/24180_1 /TAXON_ID=342587 /ORGANISM="Karlodinium micrum, Strain CCMP2283" /LENGTH=410 /DNA_ID=CAMNT_0009167565 /DNA_START=55 /DNA_END=1288 /DNA_ORIENTATION=+
MTSNLLAALKSNQGKSSTVSVNPLIEAAKAGQYDNCVRALEEERKVKVDQKDSDGVSALMHAAMGGFLNVVRFLVERGARISAKDDTGETALMKACKEGQTDVIQYLLEASLAQKKKGTTLPGSDAQKSFAAEKKRAIDAKDDEGVTALMKAAEQGEGDVVRMLLEEGASIDLKDDEGWNVLMWAALAGDLEVCDMLIRTHGLPADYTTEKGETALMKAAANGHCEVCDLLIEEGAKINGFDNEHQTALMWACANGHLACVKNLISKDAKVDLQSKLGKTALLLAAQFGRDDVCKYLILKGAKADHQDSDGKTALFAAVQAGRASFPLEALIEKQCPLEAHTKRGETALMWAAIEQQLQCVQVLINANAQIHTTDENGQKALDHAEGTLNSHIVEVLREASRAQPVPEEI